MINYTAIRHKWNVVQRSYKAVTALGSKFPSPEDMADAKKSLDAAYQDLAPDIKALKDAAAKLPDGKPKEAITLYYIQGRSMIQVAGIMGYTERMIWNFIKEGIEAMEGDKKLIDRGEVITAIQNCVNLPKCMDCPWTECESEHEAIKIPKGLILDALNLLQERR